MTSNRPKASLHYPARPTGWANRAALTVWLVTMILTLLVACSKQPTATAPPPVEVTTTTAAARDTPVELEFVADTRSSRQVEIRARV